MTPAFKAAPMKHRVRRPRSWLPLSIRRGRRGDVRDESALREILASVNAEATALFDHMVPAIATMVDKVPARELAQAVIVLADRSDPTARALSDGILEKLGKTADSHEPIFYTVQPAVRVIELFERLGMSASIARRVIPVKSAGSAQISRSDLAPEKLISRATIA